MKHKLRLVLLPVLSLFACFGQVNAAFQASAATKGGAPLSITLTASKDNFEVGAPILVTITLTNNSKADVVWQSERPDPAYRNFWFSLKTNNGADMPTTLYHRKIRGKPLPKDPLAVESGSSLFATLSPGQSVEFIIDLRKIYQIEEPGTYKLVVGRDDELNKIKIHSKPLQIRVVP
jgi:hypothetical protein